MYHHYLGSTPLIDDKPLTRVDIIFYSYIYNIVDYCSIYVPYCMLHNIHCCTYYNTRMYYKLITCLFLRRHCFAVSQGSGFVLEHRRLETSVSSRALSNTDINKQKLLREDGFQLLHICGIRTKVNLLQLIDSLADAILSVNLSKQ